MVMLAVSKSAMPLLRVHSRLWCGLRLTGKIQTKNIGNSMNWNGNRNKPGNLLCTRS